MEITNKDGINDDDDKTEMPVHSPLTS